MSSYDDHNLTDETCPPKLADGIAKALMRDELETGKAIDDKLDFIEMQLRKIARRRGIKL